MVLLQWIVCPDHAGAIEGGTTQDPPTVLSMVLDYLASSREEESFTKYMFVEKGVKPDEGQKSELNGQVNQV